MRPLHFLSHASANTLQRKSRFNALPSTLLDSLQSAFFNSPSPARGQLTSRLDSVFSRGSNILLPSKPALRGLKNDCRNDSNFPRRVLHLSAGSRFVFRQRLLAYWMQSSKVIRTCRTHLKLAANCVNSKAYTPSAISKFSKARQGDKRCGRKQLERVC